MASVCVLPFSRWRQALYKQGLYSVRQIIGPRLAYIIPDMNIHLFLVYDVLSTLNSYLIWHAAMLTYKPRTEAEVAPLHRLDCG